MTWIETISISDFKAIDTLEIDVGMLNLITGGNNAGKTSLLQAIDLAFNPKSVTKYESNIGHLINAQADSAKINLQYVESTQTSLFEFTDSDQEPSNIHERELKIIKPNADRRAQILIDTAIDVAKTGPDADFLVNRFSGETLQLNLDDDENPDEIIQTAVNNAIAGLPEDRLIRWTEGNTVILEVDGKQYPYIYLGGFYDEFKKEVVDSATNSILEKIGRTEEPLFEAEEDELENTINRSLNDLMVPRFGRGRFQTNQPSTIGGVRFIEESVQLSQDEIDLDRENAAVRLSYIGDYLREHSLVSNLDTLSLDQVVFEDSEGEKYQVPYTFMGDGFRAMVGVFWELSAEDRKNNVLLLEEAENHMHPEYINELSFHLTDILESNGIQTFITTHNIDFIRSFLEMPDKDLEEFLIDEFKLLKMDPVFPEEYDYIEAKDHATNLQLDLRG